MKTRGKKVRICRPWITRNGKRVYASQYGLKAFCFYIDSK